MKKEVKIALTAVVALVLLFVGLNFLKGINVFKATNSYYVKFDNIGGLTVSNAVYANGYPVGIVRAISYDYQRGENVLVTIELDKEMNVPKGTTAELETELMGGVKMSLLLGPNPTDLLEKNDTIFGGMHIGAMTALEGLMPTVEDMLPKLDSILANLNTLTSDPALLETLHNAADITSQLKETTQQINTMMNGDLPQMVTSLRKTSENTEQLTSELAAIDVQTTMQSVNATLENAQRLTKELELTTATLNSKLSSTDNTLGLFLNDTGVYDNLNSTFASADSLFQDLKAHPKRYVHFSVFGKKDK